MGYTVSCSPGRVAFKHDKRLFDKGHVPNNIKLALSGDNHIIVSFDDEIEEFNNYFQDEVIKFNEGKRKDRQKNNYYEEIAEGDGKEKPFYEYVLQIGNRKTNGTLDKSDDAMKCREALDNACKKLQERYPNFHFVFIGSHGDEPNGTYHYHVVFIPVGEGYKNGMKKRCSLGKALEKMGFKTDSRGFAIAQWKNDVENLITDEMQQLGLERDIKPEQERRKKRLETPQYIAEQVQQEHEKAQQLQQEAEQALKDVQDIKVEADATLAEADCEYERARSSNKQASINKTQTELAKQEAEKAKQEAEQAKQEALKVEQLTRKQYDNALITYQILDEEIEKEQHWQQEQARYAKEAENIQNNYKNNKPIRMFLQYVKENKSPEKFQEINAFYQEFTDSIRQTAEMKYQKVPEHEALQNVATEVKKDAGHLKNVVKDYEEISQRSLHAANQRALPKKRVENDVRDLENLLQNTTTRSLKPDTRHEHSL